MNQKIYDLIVIGAGAAGMFTAIHAPKKMEKLLLEKNNKIGIKVLMSGGERCNVSNIDIEPERDYFGQNTKAMYSPFKQFSNYDMIGFLEDRGVATQIEDRGRIILASGKATELVDLLRRELISNNTEIVLNAGADTLELGGNGVFTVHSGTQVFKTKKVVLSSGGKSFSSVGTDGWGYRIAQQFGHTINEPFKGLCGMVSREDHTEISGTTVFLDMQLYDGKELVYSESNGSFLFTHFGVSGPMIYNAAVRLGEYMRKSGVTPENEAHFMRDNISLQMTFNSESMTKKLEKFFSLKEDDMQRTIHINDLRSWNEAKVTGGGVILDELTKNFESKLVSGLYMAGEVIDITGKTGGFNLQSAWSQGYVIGKSFEIE
ncbi:aminoacetone oxidase family FAD-binding enzyme [Candidatus Gracilibacteria bacterium]|nr:aminoacetone oxidase family FAD-binding enzyme [Candidatus Gracilibacteria bacterium]